MIGNITKLDSGAQINYPKEGAIRDYYFAGKEGEGIARCLGGAARHLGLENGGHLNERQYDLLSDGFHPENGSKLMRGAGSRRTVKAADPANPDGQKEVARAGHRPGWDITLSDPKWGSLVYAFNGGQAKDDYLAAKRAAVEAVVREVERLARPKARKRSGEKIEMVFSEFVHDDNRAGEPQLHSHLIAHNIARFQDGTFGAVEMLPVMRHKAYLGQIYQNVIAQQMRARGYDIAMEARESQDKKTKTPYLVATLDNGTGKDAVERAEDAFSKRRAETVEAIKGDYSANKAKTAAKKTRKAKSKENVIDRNRRWKNELSALGSDMEHLFSDEALKAKSLEAGPSSEAYEKTMAEEALRAEIERIIEQSVDGKNGGWIYEHDIAAAVARSHHRLPPEELPAKIEAALGSLLPTSEREEDLWKSKIYRLPGDGGLGMRKFVAVETLRREARLVETLGRISKGEARTVSAEALEGVVAAYEEAKGFKLSENQRFAVEYITVKSGSLANIEGVAGAGKTTLLEPSVSALRLAGYDKILGCAPTGKAAEGLGESLGEENCSTVHKLLRQIERGTVKLDDKSCVVLDEAGMLGVKEWAELAEVVEKAGAKLCVIGDRKQFQAVGMRGGMDAAVKAAGEFVEVFENRRQDKAITGGKAVGDAARSAKPEKVVEMLLAEKALSAVEDEGEAIGMLARDYASDGVDVMKKMAICETNGISEEINLAIRRELKERGVLGAGLEVETELGPKDETYKKPTEFSVGDKIMFLENSRGGIFTDTETGKEAKVQNGLPARVAAIKKTAAGVEMVVECGGRSLRFNTSDYARFTHGYCHSAHKAQGATTQKTYAFLEGSAVADAGSAYVLLTRHKETVSAYATEESLDSWRERAAEHADCRLFSEAAGLLPKAWAAEWAEREPRALRSSADKPMTAEERKARPLIGEAAVGDLAVEAGEKARRAIDEKEALVADLPKQEALAEKAALAKDEAEVAMREAPAPALGGPVAAPEAPAKGETMARVEKPAKTPQMASEALGGAAAATRAAGEAVGRAATGGSAGSEIERTLVDPIKRAVEKAVGNLAALSENQQERMDLEARQKVPDATEKARQFLWASQELREAVGWKGDGLALRDERCLTKTRADGADLVMIGRDGHRCYFIAPRGHRNEGQERDGKAGEIAVLSARDHPSDNLRGLLAKMAPGDGLFVRQDKPEWAQFMRVPSAAEVVEREELNRTIRSEFGPVKDLAERIRPRRDADEPALDAFPEALDVPLLEEHRRRLDEMPLRRLPEAMSKSILEGLPGETPDAVKLATVKASQYARKYEKALKGGSAEKIEYIEKTRADTTLEGWKRTAGRIEERREQIVLGAVVCRRAGLERGPGDVELAEPNKRDLAELAQLGRANDKSIIHKDATTCAVLSDGRMRVFDFGVGSVRSAGQAREWVAEKGWAFGAVHGLVETGKAAVWHGFFEKAAGVGGAPIKAFEAQAQVETAAAAKRAREVSQGRAR